MDITASQLEICRKYDAECVPLNIDLKIGISDNFFSGELPLNGLRHPAEGDTCGWYLWAGETFSEAANFFNPLHISHLVDQHAEILRYLGLPPGWRFLIAGDHEDVWFDAALLEI
jgi:hypothetical protein